MSWDESKEMKTCPCSNSYYEIIHRENDWFQTEEYWKMICPKCNKNYSLFKYSTWDSGMSIVNYIWVENKLYNDYISLQNQIGNIQIELLEYAKKEYLHTWIQYFNNMKSKKEIWKILTNNGSRYPSLSTFYAHTKGKDITEYLQDQFSVIKISHILDIIKVKDKIIDEMIFDIDEKQKSLLSKERNMIKHGFR